MKRLATLVLALCLTFGAATQANALEVIPSGVMDFVFVYSSGPLYGDGFVDDTELDRFDARTRSRIQLDFIASENLRGVMMLQFAHGDSWGTNGSALDTTSDGALVRRLYLDFYFPDSPVNMKMGLMDLVLPYATFGQPVFGNHVAAVTMSADVSDNASLTAFWARPLRGDSTTKDNDMDVFGLWANLDFDSFTIAPWVAYASIGTNSGWFEREFGITNKVEQNLNNGMYYGVKMDNDTANWWGAGLALTADFTDNFSLRFDAMYASLKFDGDMSVWDGVSGYPAPPTDRREFPDARGYYLALALDYAFDWGTLSLFGIYSSGDDDDDDKIGRLPGLAYDDNIWPTRMAFAGSMTCANDTYISASGIGLWMVGLQLADFSFIENVTHTMRVAYIRGTNHIDSKALYNNTDALNLGAMIPLVYEDQAWEVGIDTYWQMYENLTVGFEFAWMRLDASDNTGSSGIRRDELYDLDNVISGNLIFRFGF